jgi:benzoyl-CoA reductase/2-hydroxyglutaryl-CoA dehydratase subunit BcrC/BadD/HgdB
MNFQTSKKTVNLSKEIWPMVKQYYAWCKEAKQAGKKVVWTVGLGPNELLHAFGLAPIFLEQYSIVMAGRHQVTRYLEMAENLGFSRDSCSYHRALIGYAMEPDGLMIPKPDLVLTTATPCDSSSKSFIALVNRLGIPYYYLDIPFNCTEGAGEAHQFDYVEEQLKELVSFLEKETGVSLTSERLGKVVGLANRANDLWAKINDLRKAVPCPMTVADEMGLAYPLFQLPGTEQAVQFYEKVLAEVGERVRKGEGAIPNERYRILWLGPAAWYHLRLLNYVEEYGGVLVKSDFDYLTHGWIDPGNPLRGMGEKMISGFLNGVVENRIRLARRFVQDYRINGVIAFSHFGCRQYGGGQRAVKDALFEEFGIPTLILEGDNIDERNYADDQVRSRIEDFISLMML